LIDSPLLQRLRRIRQTGLAYLVYPSATHTRFEHSLGVTILVGKLVTHLRQNNGSDIISKKDEYSLRLAALLHDVGHSFLSHVSEQIYERFDDYQKLKLEINSIYKVSPKGHEIMSFLILRSEVFQNCFVEILNAVTPNINDGEAELLKELDWEEIALYIIGYSKNPQRKYLADIINGPIDCDKLDYLSRDAKFAGPVIAYDIDRYLYTVTTATIGDNRRLTVLLSGSNVIEQLVISKMMMFSYVYHHPKLRAAEALLKRLCFDIIRENKNGQVGPISLKHPTDFLSYTDENILNSMFIDPSVNHGIKDTIDSLLNRKLWIRGQLISCFNTSLNELPTKITMLERDLHLDDNITRLKAIKEKIVKQISIDSPGLEVDAHDIWIDVPFAPSSSEAKQIVVKKNLKLEDTIELSEIFPLDQWVEAYKSSKLKGHVFCDRKIQGPVYKATKKVFQDEFGFTTLDYTKDFIKVEE
jgi:uncharacterized protein